MKNIEDLLKEEVEMRGFTIEDLTSEELEEARKEILSLKEGEIIMDSILDDPNIRLRIWANKTR